MLERSNDTKSAFLTGAMSNNVRSLIKIDDGEGCVTFTVLMDTTASSAGANWGSFSKKRHEVGSGPWRTAGRVAMMRAYIAPLLGSSRGQSVKKCWWHWLVRHGSGGLGAWGLEPPVVASMAWGIALLTERSLLVQDTIALWSLASHGYRAAETRSLLRRQTFSGAYAGRQDMRGESWLPAGTEQHEHFPLSSLVLSLTQSSKSATNPIGIQPPTARYHGRME